MKANSSVLAPTAVFAIALLFQTAVAQITFVETPALQRNQGQQGQQGLSPEKKTRLSKIGPEDAFPGAREQETNQSRSNRGAARQSSSRPQPSPRTTPTPSPATTPSTVAAASPTPASRIPTPMATVAASTGSSANALQLNKSQPGKPAASYVVPATLSLATVLVFGALIYAVGILRKKLKSES